MSGARWLVGMVVGTALTLLLGARPDRVTPTPTPRLPPERPWLTPAAAAEVFGDSGRMGPLFDDVELGGPAPPSPVRARIAEFARTHDLDIDLEMREGT